MIRKVEREANEKVIAEPSTNQPPMKDRGEEKNPVGRELFPTRKKESKDKSERPTTNDDMLTGNFDTGSEPSLDINCNVVSILPVEYDQVMKIEEYEETTEEEMTKHRPVCYYIMSNGCIKEYNVVFERPDKAMKNHLKPLFIRGKVENVGTNKVLVYGGATVNLMPHFMLNKIEKFNTDLKPHNIVLSNY